MRLFSFFHARSKDIQTLPQDVSEWPSEWTNVTYKVYPGASTLVFDKQEVQRAFKETDVRTLVKKRRTSKKFVSSNSVGRETLGELLFLSCGEIYHGSDGRPRRAYPSAGGLYPVEVYVYVRKGVASVSPGMYHYRPDIHGLEYIAQALEEEGFFLSDAFSEAPLCIFVTGVFERSGQKYGERAYRYTLLEAGHLGQNIVLLATGMGLRSACVGGVDEAVVERVLGIDGISESVISSIVIG